MGVRKGAAWIRECPGERPSHGQVTPAGSRFRLLGGAHRIDNPRSGFCLGAGASCRLGRYLAGTIGSDQQAMVEWVPWAAGNLLLRNDSDRCRPVGTSRALG